MVRQLTKKHGVRKSFDSEHVKGSQTIMKSSWEQFYHIFHHSEGKWFGKYLPYWSLKSQGCLLTHELSITSILFRIVRIFPSIFKCNYLKNQNHFLSFFLLLWNLHQILNIFKKKKIVITKLFLKFTNV